MPFLAPLGIAAAGSIGSSLIGGLFNKPAKPTALQQGVLGADQNTMATQQANAGSLIPQGQNLLGMATQGYQPVTDYYSKILSGNQGAMASALAPEIGQINRGFNTAQQTSATLTPRGGPRADIAGDQTFARQGAITNLFQTARPQAAQGLLSTAQSAAGAGSNILGQATNALYGSTVAGQSILGQQQQAVDLAAKQGQAIGGGLFSMFQQYGMPALQKQFPGLFGGRGGGGSNPQPGDSSFVGPVQ
jgi:hypothetical protein